MSSKCMCSSNFKTLEVQTWWHRLLYAYDRSSGREQATCIMCKGNESVSHRFQSLLTATLPLFKSVFLLIPITEMMVITRDLS